MHADGGRAPARYEALVKGLRANTTLQSLGLYQLKASERCMRALGAAALEGVEATRFKFNDWLLDDGWGEEEEEEEQESEEGVEAAAGEGDAEVQSAEE